MVGENNLKAKSYKFLSTISVDNSLDNIKDQILRPCIWALLPNWSKFDLFL